MLIFSRRNRDTHGLIHHEGVNEGVLVREKELLDFCASILRSAGHEVLFVENEDNITEEIPLPGADLEDEILIGRLKERGYRVLPKTDNDLISGQELTGEPEDDGNPFGPCPQIYLADDDVG